MCVICLFDLEVSLSSSVTIESTIAVILSVIDLEASSLSSGIGIKEYVASFHNENLKHLTGI
jgi:hypothetical protein